MEVGPLARMLVAYGAGHAAGAARSSTASLAEARRRPRGAVLDPRAGRGARHRDPGARREDGRLGRRAGRQHGPRRSAHPRQQQVGARRRWPRRLHGRRLPRGAARRARPLGAHRATARSPTTSASCRAPGTPARATRRPSRTVRGGAARHAGRRSPSSRWRSCARSTPSIRAWRAASTSSTRSAASCSCEGRDDDHATDEHRSVADAAPAERIQARASRWSASTCGRCRCGVTHWLIVLSIAVLVGDRHLHRPAVPHRPPARRRSTSSWGPQGDPLLCRHRLHARRPGASLVWMFLGNRYARWDKFLPVRESRRRGILPTLKFYLFAAAQAAGASSATTRSPAWRTASSSALYFVDDRDRARALRHRRRTSTRRCGCSPPSRPLRRPADGALDPPRLHVAAARLRRAPRLQLGADVADRAERHDRVDLLRLQVRAARRSRSTRAIVFIDPTKRRSDSR